MEAGLFVDLEGTVHKGLGELLYRQTWRDGIVLREIRKVLNGQEMQRKQDMFQEHVWRVEWKI